jgi:outer membrane immunogenic protein
MNNRAFTIAALVSGAAGLAPIASAQAADWTGFYFGAGAGYSMKSDDSETLLFDTDRDGVFDDTVFTTAPADAFSPGFCTGAAQGRAPADGCRETDDDINYGVRAGYDWQSGPMVFGIVGEYSVQNIGDDVTGFSTTPASYTFSRDLEQLGAVRGRVGYGFNSSLVYATGGYAWGELDQRFTTTNGANSFTPSGADDADGYQLGVGYEYFMPSQWMGGGMSIGIEYLYTSLEDEGYVVAVGPGAAGPTNPFLLVDATGTDMKRSNEDFEFSSVGVTLNWRQ